MNKDSRNGRAELPVRFTVPNLSVRDCVELAAGLATYAQIHGIPQIEVSGPPVIGELAQEFGFNELRFVDDHQQPGINIPAVPPSWRCGQRGLRCFSEQIADTTRALSPSDDVALSRLTAGSVMRFSRHNRLGDALGIVSGLEHYCRDNDVESVAVSGSHSLAEVVEAFACDRVAHVSSSSEAIDGDAVFARSSWSVPWLSRFNLAVADIFGGRARHQTPPLRLRAMQPPESRGSLVYCQFDARSSTPVPRDAARHVLSKLGSHGEVRVLGGPDTQAYLGEDITYVRADLNEMIACLLSCRLFVGCDSGVGHLAGCLGVPGLIVSTDDFETTWSFFRGYSNLNVIPMAAAELFLS
ncbi:glycosyltransferase family 9 protein [Sciscionella marina]|uniref:glycosyltransferase family 9 protein n=1 Tax=Sciscionella marina TaxID=508770 RepID=UPI000371B983|nr:glycosyltransferase family 9 protein [Sciscionella marina]